MTNELIEKAKELNRKISETRNNAIACEKMIENTTAFRKSSFSFNGIYADVPEHYVSIIADILYNYHYLSLLKLELDFQELGVNHG